MAQALTKNFKVSDGHAVPVQCDSPNSNAGGPAHDPSERLECDVNALTDGSDGSSREDTAQRNGGADCTQASGIDGKHVQTISTTEMEVTGVSNMVSGITVAPANFSGYAGTGCGKIEGGATSVAYAGAGLPFDDLVLDERQFKRERRKQANRESARKSRMRKQAEYEELLRKCDTLNMENMALKSELDQLNDNSEKLRLENAALMEKLELSQAAKQGGMISNKIEAELSLGNCTKNIPDASDHGNANANVLLDCNNHESSNSESKLHNLMESSSRTGTISAR